MSVTRHNVHRVSAQSSGGEQRHETYGAGSDDDDRRALRHSGPAHSVDSDGQRLDQRTLFRGHARQEPEQPGRVPSDKLGESATPTWGFATLGTMERLPALTEHAYSASLPVTDRVYGDQIADANRPGVGVRQRHHLASNFVAVG